MYLQLVHFFHTYHGRHAFFLFYWVERIILFNSLLVCTAPLPQYILYCSYLRWIVKYMRKQSAKIGVYVYIVDRYIFKVKFTFEYFSIIIHYTLWLCHCHSKTIDIVYFIVTYFIKRSGYHDIPWAFQALLKLENKFYSRHHELVDSTQMTNDLRLF